MTDLYDDLIMEHIKNVRNYRAIDDANCQAIGTNPLCGDEMLVLLNVNGDRIADVAFQCTCCGISTASASIMTDTVKGEWVAEARRAIGEFLAMVNSLTSPPSLSQSAEYLALFRTLDKFPTRARCAILPWVTLESALGSQREPRS